MTKKKPPKKKPKKAKKPRPITQATRRQIKAAHERSKIKGAARRKAEQQVLPFAPAPETVGETEIEMERKLSAKIIVGKRIEQVTESTDLFTVIGIATGIRQGQSTYGDWEALRGRFEVTRAEDGKVLTAPLMILPPPALAEMFPGEVSVHRVYGFPFEFALRVGVDPSTNGAGFEYRVTMLVKPRPHDPMLDLRQAAGQASTGVGHGG
jgi:hypothetical protein